MRILITGAQGQLGTALQRVFADSSFEVIALGKSDFDITKNEQITEIIKKISPQVVINCAAFNQVENAGERIEEVYRLNAFAPYQLAVAVKKVGCRLIQMSSDYVFDGSKQSYSEADLPHPVNVYGMSRLAGEQLVQIAAPDSIIIRTSWLFGDSKDPQSHNFVKGIMKKAVQEGSVRVVSDQIGIPTYAYDLALTIRQLLEKQTAPGIYHITNSGQCSWYDFTKKIFELANITAPIVSITTAQSGTKIKRPAFSVLVNQRLAEMHIAPLRHWSEALSEYLKK